MTSWKGNICPPLGIRTKDPFRSLLTMLTELSLSHLLRRWCPRRANYSGLCHFAWSHSLSHSVCRKMCWNPGGGEIFRTSPYRPCGPLRLLQNGYRVSFSGIKLPGLGLNDPSTSSAEVNERVELYLYSASGPSWSDLV